MQNILILGISCPTDEMLIQTRSACLHAMPIPCGGSCRIITGDGYGIEAEAARICLGATAIPLLVVGTSVRPANNIAPMKYYERVVCASRNVAARKRERDAYLMRLADYVVFLGREHHRELIALFAAYSSNTAQSLSMSLS